jgi:hypothetical protein
MEFEAFTASELAAYLGAIPKVRALLGEPDDLDVAEVGDGNLNYVYFVTNAKAPQRSVVVKQAPPFCGWSARRGRCRVSAWSTKSRPCAASARFARSMCPRCITPTASVF